MTRIFTAVVVMLLSVSAFGMEIKNFNVYHDLAIQDTCLPISTLPCAAVKVNLPYNLGFNAAVPNTIVDKNGNGTGFTTVNTYSGTRLAADGTPSVLKVPGYEPSKITVTGGRLQLVSNKGIDFQANNNQLNVLGVKLNSPQKLQIEVKVVNPYNGTQSQQAGLWYGLSDKTYIKLSVTGNKVELRREFNDVSSTAAGTSNPDQRVTAVISNLNTKTVRLRMIVDFTQNKVEGFYSTDGTNYISTGNSYPTKTLSLSGLNITDTLTYAGIFATHRNATTAVTYSFDDFALTNLSPAPPQPSFKLSAPKIDFTVIKGGTVLPQSMKVLAVPSLPQYTISKSPADWLTLPSPTADSIHFGAQNISSNLPAGTYQAMVTCEPVGFPPVSFMVNLNVIEPLQQQAININFQDQQTIPPVNYIRDFGQAYGPRSNVQQGAGLEYGWKRRSTGAALNLSQNGRNRNTPEDILLATLMHMQANHITTTFTGTKIEGYWEMKVPNGTYDVSVSAGDGAVNAAQEIHSLNVEGVSAISGFVPSGKAGSIGRFRMATVRVQVNDEYLTINADGGKNTKINSAKIVPVSAGPYLYWGAAAQNIVYKKGNPNTDLFSLALGNSDNAVATYNVTATYNQATTGWLTFTQAQIGKQPVVSFKYNTSKNLPVGTYSAVIKATSGQYSSASFAVQLSVVDSLKPYVVSSSPVNGATKVSLSTVSIAANSLHIPLVTGFPGGVDNNTITNETVKLYKVIDNTSTEVTGTVQGTGGGDAISFSPSSSLEPQTIYKFVVTSGVKSNAGASFSPFECQFTTDAASIDSSEFLYAQFIKDPVPGTQNKQYTSLAIGPDDKFYALRIDGGIERFNINHNTGALTHERTINTLKTKYGNRSAIGLAFDPHSTPTNITLWISHSSGGLTSAPAFDGNISRLSGDSLQTEELVITKLPRSTKDHLVNGLAFGPDSALYICQGSNSSAGVYDNDWMRDESLLAGAVLRLDVHKLAGITLPLNVQTTANLTVINNAPSTAYLMSDGTYNPYGSSSPLTIFGSGVRNAYDLVWHSNGQLYVPANGSGGGGNSPESVTGTRRPDGSFYHGPAIPAANGIKVQHDWLFRINPAKPVGYYGHPNPLRGEYVINRGFEDNPLYLPTIVADSNYRKGYDFGLNNSPNGVIEYRSNAFGGVLKGKLMVCRFSGGGDIIVMEPGSMVKTTYENGNDHIYDIIKVNTGSSNSGLQGMSAFGNPLDIAQDTISGNLYVSEFNWNDNPNLTSQITLLKIHEEPMEPLAKMTLAAIENTDINDEADEKHLFTLSNNGDGELKVKSMVLTGPDAAKLKIVDVPLPSASNPLTLRKNSSILFKVLSSSSKLTDKEIAASLRVVSVDDTVREVSIKRRPRGSRAEVSRPQVVTVSNVFNVDSHHLQVYPNPATNGQVNIKLDSFGRKEPVTIYLYNMMGQMQRTISGVTDEQGVLFAQLALSRQNQGNFYIVRVTYPNGSRYAKIMVNN
ncbi:T9SS type A sorting domain-containing protein [Mucilaginibacter limnophilus]|uniref:T9SS type A sorting domain-containing protein n=1 Tax=Mucilaginibacter limnophilus TaxID=1932778 RepID=A0A3S2VPQ9_9SPHI|nr:Ig-like domain-containing protein [Mucilaginibacter limnophilus]RVU02459.1 T9SS type A sorting domain-containing protein [Mucilaginibacter limnophilus]